METQFHNVSFATALIAFTLIYLSIRPRLASWGRDKHLMTLVGLHMFRYVGLIFLLPNLFDSQVLGLPLGLTKQAAYWDYLNAVLAIIAFFALLNQFAWRTVAVWAFAVVAIADLLITGTLLMPYLSDANKLGTFGFQLVAIYLPALIVSNVAVFFVLLKKQQQ
jgi:hypothetical protein